MTIDFYMPVDCIWYSLIALYLIGYVIFARRLYPKVLPSYANGDLDIIFTSFLSLLLAVLWPIIFINLVIFYGVKNENN